MIVTGKTPKGALIKETDKESKAGTSNSREPPIRRVKFDLSGENEGMETEIQEPDVVPDEGTQTPSVARAPSFFIGKPLKDYDVSNGRVGHETAMYKCDKNNKKSSCKLRYGSTKGLISCRRPLDSWAARKLL